MFQALHQNPGSDLEEMRLRGLHLQQVTKALACNSKVILVDPIRMNPHLLKFYQ